jgi:hypothetical protein
MEGEAPDFVASSENSLLVAFGEHLKHYLGDAFAIFFFKPATSSGVQVALKFFDTDITHIHPPITSDCL